MAAPPRDDGGNQQSAAEKDMRAAELSLGISRHLARADVVEFSSGSSSGSSSGGSDYSSDSLDTTSLSPAATAQENQRAAAAKEEEAAAPPPPPGGNKSKQSTSTSSGGGGGGGGGVSALAARRGELFVEPEWQRAAGRWTRFEEGLLTEMKVELQDDLKAAPPFPEVVGTRRMLRFLRGHNHDAAKAAAMMRRMLQWRKDNGVDDIREDIMQNKKFDPSLFPEGEMITKLFPLLVASPLCVDMDGAPISYESYEFSPRQVTAHANGDLGFFIKFHIYCQEFKQICLDSLSDAKEMENLARRAKRALSPSPPPTESTATGPRVPATGGGGCGGGTTGGEGRDTGAGRGMRGNASTIGGGGLPLPESEDKGGTVPPKSEGRGVESEKGEEPWGVVLRNTIIRDLSGFGMEHAGTIGRSLISQVLAVSQDNYPEMMEKCYIINAPWVFYALWKGLQPLMSAGTAKKVQMLKYDVLSSLSETISLERLPTSAGGVCDPDMVTTEQMHDFVVCGRVAKLPGGDGAALSERGSGASVDDSEQEEEEEGDRLSGEQRHRREGAAGGLAGSGSSGRSSRRGSSLQNSCRSGAGDRTAAGGSSKSHITFRSLFERLQARDDPRELTAAAAATVGGPQRRRLGSSPSISRAASFQSHASSFYSPPLSRHGSNASASGHGGGGGSRRQDPRLSPGRPFASPGPRGIRRSNTGGVEVGAGGGGDGANGSDAGWPTGGAGAAGEDQAEDFDSRLVGPALKLSMKRKARRFKASEAAAGGGGAAAARSGDGGVTGDRRISPLPGERSSEVHEKGGWAKKKWRALKERREGKKLLEKGFLPDLPGLSAGDCAEWIPNSARNSCLHCERPFTLILRRHHCRMCGELVCGLCSPHRVRLADEGRPEGTTGDGGDGVQGPSSRRRNHRRSRNARMANGDGGPRAVAVRVCTDCHFSLQTVTVASSAALQQQHYGGGVENDDDDESLLRRMGDGGGGGGGGVVSARGRVRDNRRGDAGAGAGGAGDGGGSVERVEEAACSMEGMAGDVVLEDVLEWGRIQRRASKSWEVVGACLLVVVEMHHNKLLEVGVRAWRASNALLYSAARHTVATLASTPPPSSSTDRSCDSGGADRRGGCDGVVGPSTNGNRNREGSSSSRPGSQRSSPPSAPLGPSPAAAVAAVAAAAAAAGAAREEAWASCPEAVVSGAEAALWAGLGRAGSYRSSTWLLLAAVLAVVMFKM